MIAAITAGLSILAVLLEVWIQARPQRKEGSRNEEIQEGRSDLINGGVSDIERRIDNILRDNPDDSPSGSADPEDFEGRIGKL
jgi:hypothetical protein